jgi:hypothetical protein
MSDQSLYLLTEAAERTGLTVEAIRQRIKRGKLEAMKGNDGMLRVRLTTADLEAIRDQSATGHVLPMSTGQPVDHGRFSKALQDAAEARGEAAALRERAEMAEARADRAQAEAAVERVRAAQAEREREEARVRAATAEGEGKALRERAERAEADKEALRAKLEEWGRGGPLARAWRAFSRR